MVLLVERRLSPPASTDRSPRLNRRFFALREAPSTSSAAISTRMLMAPTITAWLLCADHGLAAPNVTTREYISVAPRRRNHPPEIVREHPVVDKCPIPDRSVTGHESPSSGVRRILPKRPPFALNRGCRIEYDVVGSGPTVLTRISTSEVSGGPDDHGADASADKTLRHDACRPGGPRPVSICSLVGARPRMAGAGAGMLSPSAIRWDTLVRCGGSR